MKKKWKKRNWVAFKMASRRWNAGSHKCLKKEQSRMQCRMSREVNVQD